MAIISRREALLKTAVSGSLLVMPQGVRAANSLPTRTTNSQLFSPDLLRYYLSNTAPIARRLRAQQHQPGDFQKCAGFTRLLGHHLRTSGYDSVMKALIPLIDPGTVSLAPIYSPSQLAFALQRFDPSITSADLVAARPRSEQSVKDQIEYIANNGVSGIYLSMASFIDAFASLDTHLTLLKSGGVDSRNRLQKVVWKPSHIAFGYRYAAFNSDKSNPKLVLACAILDKLKNAKNKFCKDNSNPNGSYNWQDTPTSDGVTELEQAARTACATYKSTSGSSGDPELDATIATACATVTIISALDQALLMPLAYGLANVVQDSLFQLLGC